MALFYECWKRRRTTLDALDQLLDDAKADEESERRAAINIQRLFRGQFVRARVTTQTNAEIVLSRVYRGHLARRRCRSIRTQMDQQEKRAVFEYYIILIQKMMRGVHSRHTKLDFKKRKAYVREIAQKGHEMRARLDANLQRQQVEEAAATEQATKQELAQVTQHLHHLVSTKAISGVYNSPMLASQATAFGVPVETHIRMNSRNLVASQLASTVHAKPPTKLVPYPPSNKASIQAASHYDTPLKEVRVQKKYHKLKRISATDFQTVHNSNQDTLKKLSAPGINTGVTYLDDWENPYKKRGIPKDKNDLLPKITTLGKPPKEKEKQPFYMSSGGNKSKVYANDRFDV